MQHLKISTWQSTQNERRRTNPQKKGCCVLACWKRPLQNYNTRSYFETKNSHCHIKTNHFKTNNACSHLNTDPSNQWAFWLMNSDMSATTRCCKPPRYVPYKCTYVPYDGTFGASEQGQMLDMWQGVDSQIHHLIRQIRRFTISSVRKKSNQKRYRRIRISTTILDHTDRN